jgi:hypothetical protein
VQRIEAQTFGAMRLLLDRPRSKSMFGAASRRGTLTREPLPDPARREISDGPDYIFEGP